jgi:hypothetical protein
MLAIELADQQCHDKSPHLSKMGPRPIAIRHDGGVYFQQESEAILRDTIKLHRIRYADKLS